MKALIALIVLLIGTTQDSAQRDRVMQAVRAALAPALDGVPDTEPDGAVPVGGNTEALWMVRRLEPADTAIEIIANPLNDANQRRATRAMAQIDTNIQAAQRRAELQYERAMAEAKRTGKSQDVDGVTLADEGAAGAKIDAESHVAIEVSFNQPSYTFAIASSVQPRVKMMSVPGHIASTIGNTYRDALGERFAEAQTVVFLGSVAVPAIAKTGDHSYEVSAAATATSAPYHSLVIRLKGNETLIAELLQKSNWNALVELLK